MTLEERAHELAREVLADTNWLEGEHAVRVATEVILETLLELHTEAWREGYTEGRRDQADGDP